MGASFAKDFLFEPAPIDSIFVEVGQRVCIRTLQVQSVDGGVWWELVVDALLSPRLRGP